MENYGINKDEVRVAYLEIIKSGCKPTISGIMEFLGRGRGRTTVERHLKEIILNDSFECRQKAVHARFMLLVSEFTAYMSNMEVDDASNRKLICEGMQPRLTYKVNIGNRTNCPVHKELAEIKIELVATTDKLKSTGDQLIKEKNSVAIAVKKMEALVKINEQQEIRITRLNRSICKTKFEFDRFKSSSHSEHMSEMWSVDIACRQLADSILRITSDYQKAQDELLAITRDNERFVSTISFLGKEIEQKNATIKELQRPLMSDQGKSQLFYLYR